MCSPLPEWQVHEAIANPGSIKTTAIDCFPIYFMIENTYIESMRIARLRAGTNDNFILSENAKTSANMPAWYNATWSVQLAALGSV